jgi:hypothetical protein
MARSIFNRVDGLPLLRRPICGWQNDILERETEMLHRSDSMMDRTTEEFPCRYSVMPIHLSTRMEEMEADL